MKTRVVSLTLVIVGLLVGSSPGSTHHSNAIVDKDTLYTVTGEVTEWAFVSPHVAVYWDGEAKNGEVVNWYASGGPPRLYASRGWNNKTFQEGERILVQGHPLRDGRPIMQFMALYRCNGENLPLDDGNLDEYRTRMKIVLLEPERVQQLCEEGTLIEGLIE